MADWLVTEAQADISSQFDTNNCNAMQFVVLSTAADASGRAPTGITVAMREFPLQ